MRRIWRRGQFEAEMEAEVRHHLECREAELVRRGVSREEARRRARVEFGGVDLYKEECREAWGWRALDEVRADLRLALRNLRTNPGFASVAVLSLALGIGANGAIFGVYDAVMLRVMPVRDPGRLVFVRTAGYVGADGPPYPLFEEIRDRARSFEAVGAFSPSSMELNLGAGREQARGVWVSPNFYEMLGVRPVLGRSLTDGDGGAAVISRSYWAARFGSDPKILGRTIYSYEHALTIVGVMPDETMSLNPGSVVDLAVPNMLSDPVKMRDRTSLWLEAAVARLKPGVTEERAWAEVEGIFRGYMAETTVSPEVRRMLFDHMRISPAGKGMGDLRSQFAKPLTALLILAGLALLAACVNVTGLMLARATARHRDFAVRLAMGAGRGRLVRQNLTEAAAIAGAAAAAGLVVARAGAAGLVAFFAGGQQPIALDLSLNMRMLVATAAVALASAVALGVAPALRAAGIDPAAGLHGGSRGASGSRASRRVSKGLVAAQVALSMALLAGAGLFVRSLERLQAVDTGFARQGVVTMEISPERERIASAAWSAAQAEILERVRAIPEVRSAAWATYTPLSGRGRGAAIEIPGFQPRAETDREIHLLSVSPEYFETIGQAVLLGRGVHARDQAGAPKVAVINEEAARFYFGGGSPIGRTLRFTNYPRQDLVYEIVGVARDAKHDSLREAAPRFVYLPIAQAVDRIGRLALVARSSGDPRALEVPVLRQIRGAHPELLIQNVATMEEQIERSLLRERLVAALATAFGAVALALACIGLYGVVAYAVTRRTNEIGVRMALGASRGSVMWLVLRESLALTGAGVLVGAALAVALGSAMRASLYGVGVVDPVAFGMAGVALAVSAALAAWLPGRRASRLDPVSALRVE